MVVSRLVHLYLINVLYRVKITGYNWHTLVLNTRARLVPAKGLVILSPAIYALFMDNVNLFLQPLHHLR